MAVTQAQMAQAIRLTWEICGASLSEEASTMMMTELKPYGGEAVLRALAKIRHEKKGRPSMADVVEHLQAADGRPSKEEAWGIALECLNDDTRSFLLTDEISEACAAARPAMEARDKVAARMAFLERYAALVSAARESGKPARWFLTIGERKDDATDAVALGVKLGRITVERGLALLPSPEQAPDMLTLAGVSNHPLLAPPTPEQRGNARKALTQIIAGLSGKVVKHG